MHGRRRRRRNRRIRRIVTALIVIAAAAGFIWLCLPTFCVRPELTVEAGEKCPEVSGFLKWKNENAVFVSEINETSVMDGIGDYKVVIQVYGRKVESVLHVTDTVPPELVTKNVTIFGGESVRVEDFVEEVRDVTAVSLRFVKEPDCVTEGVNKVFLEARDEGGNISSAEVLLEVLYDKEPPVIRGVRELTMTAGGSISYKKGITVTDNYDQDVELIVDNSAVNTLQPGNYNVIYMAVDASGNRAVASTILHVLPVTVDTVTEEVINAEADKLLATIINDSMSQYEKAKAIYNWCHGKIAYSDGTPKTNWVQGAYRGIVERKGDCYTYAATAKCLLTRAGIKNMDIEKIPAQSMHYWNLIDIGEGWHHFDTCRRKDGSTFFYKTDAELMEYSNTHGKTHNYDRNLYPEIP